MQKKTPQDYARELLEMYRSNASEIEQTASMQTQSPPLQDTLSEYTEPIFEDGTGGLNVIVTTLRQLYPVKGAFVTVFTGQGNNATVIETSVTDESGKANMFNLKTPAKAASQQAENGNELPYANYNISVKSDGYVEQIAMNVPVFSGVVSVQNIDLTPISAAGNHTAPQIIQEGNSYNL